MKSSLGTDFTVVKQIASVKAVNSGQQPICTAVTLYNFVIYQYIFHSAGRTHHTKIATTLIM